MGVGTGSAHNRRLVQWESHHDNGWTTIIREQADGTFVAYAANGQASAVDYVDRNIAHANAAVMAALRRKSGHQRCSAECSDWRLQLPPQADPHPAD